MFPNLSCSQIALFPWLLVTNDISDNVLLQANLSWYARYSFDEFLQCCLLSWKIITALWLSFLAVSYISNWLRVSNVQRYPHWAAKSSAPHHIFTSCSIFVWIQLSNITFMIVHIVFVKWYHIAIPIHSSKSRVRQRLMCSHFVLLMKKRKEQQL